MQFESRHSAIGQLVHENGAVLLTKLMQEWIWHNRKCWLIMWTSLKWESRTILAKYRPIQAKIDLKHDRGGCPSILSILVLSTNINKYSIIGWLSHLFYALINRIEVIESHNQMADWLGIQRCTSFKLRTTNSNLYRLNNAAKYRNINFSFPLR